MKKERWPKHKMGKNYGYEEYEDGRIQIAGVMSDILEKALDEQRALNAFVAAVNAHLIASFKTIEKEKKRFWDKVREEYGLKGEFTYRDGILTPIKEEKEG